MRRLLFSVLALFGFVTSAIAADMPVRSAAAPVAVMAPVSNWTGWYAGGTLGWARASWKFTFYDDQVPAGGSKTVSDNGIVGGLTLGQNFQSGNWVYGWEFDYQASSLHSNQQGGFSFDSCGCFEVNVEHFGTLRARAGWLMTPTMLLYGTGGLLVGKLHYEANDSTPKGSDDPWKAGWTAGGGIEWMVTNVVSMKLEYLHLGFGKPHFNLGDPGFNTDLAVHGDLVRVGINAKLN